MKVIVITAHPDDLEIGCSGTLLELKAQGASITSIITVAPSEESNINRSKDVVSDELRKSIEISNFDTRVFDTDLHKNGRPKLICDNITMTRLSELIDCCDLAILPTPEDYHQDHKNTFDLAWPIVLKKAKTIWTMHSWPYCYFYQDSHPNLFRNISNHWHKKEEMLTCYSSYFSTDKIEKIKRTNQYWGDQSNFSLAEAFTVRVDRG